MDMNSPFIDHAAPILSGDPSLSDQQRSDLWDAFATKNADELAQHLSALAIPNETKHRLWQAKQASLPVPSPTDKVTAAVTKIASLDPQIRQIAEASPNLLKAFTTAATTPEKEPAAPASGASAESKGTKAPKVEKPPVTPLAPRPDGQPHFPAIPDGHHRILASDGGVHDIPAENIEQARALDPNLHVLNPES
jgi:hypothetical protein